MSKIQELIANSYGFVSQAELKEVVAENPMQMILVRCGAGRFLCPAQDAAHFIDIVTRENSDYVRDASIYTKG